MFSAYELSAPHILGDEEMVQLGAAYHDMQRKAASPGSPGMQAARDEALQAHKQLVAAQVAGTMGTKYGHGGQHMPCTARDEVHVLGE